MTTTETRWRQGETDGRTDRPEIPTSHSSKLAASIAANFTRADFWFQDAVRGKRRNAEVDNAVIAWTLASIGRIADEVDRLVEATGATVAAVSARGDRIDRVQTQNRVAIDALIADARR